MSRLFQDKKSIVILKGILLAHFTRDTSLTLLYRISLFFHSYLNDLYKGKVEAPVLRWSGGTGYKRACA